MDVDTTVIKDEDKIRLRNLTKNTAVYITPSTNIRREIPAQGYIYVTAGELRECSYDIGCSNIFHDYIQICNPALASEFGVPTDEVEYNWTEKDVEKVLVGNSQDDYNRFLDALDFAPAGIKQNIVDMSVELEIPDMRRREAIRVALGVDVSRMIQHKHEIEQGDETEAKKPAKRRASTSTAKTTATKQRRASTKSTATRTKKTESEEA